MTSHNAGIYIHIPFCKKKCLYCDFYSLADVSLRDEYVKALCSHIKKRADIFKNKPIDSVFFGGGTPSILSCENLADIFNALEAFQLSQDCEITLEANPGSADKNKLLFLKSLGINRLSLGIQSFDNNLLKALGRIHSADEAEKTVFDAYNAGFENISSDFMFALPYQTADLLKETLERAVKLPLSHISLYGLKIEAGTPFSKMAGLPYPDEDEYGEMYLSSCSFLKESGFEQYEISNFAKEGFSCRHNEKYWSMDEYISFGAAAASFIDNTRFLYCRDIKKYISMCTAEDAIVTEKSVLTKEDRLYEYIMLSLRTSKGLSYTSLKTLGAKDFPENIAAELISHSMAEKTDAGFRLTPEGFLVSNEIIVRFTDELLVNKL